jgi:hypothetical protein
MLIHLDLLAIALALLVPRRLQTVFEKTQLSERLSLVGCRMSPHSPSLSLNNIRASGATAIANMLKTNTTLNTL